MVPSNWRVIQLATLNGEIEVIEGHDHYITDGFDVEAVGRPPIESIFERPSSRHLSFNTLTLPAKTKFDIKTVPQPQDSYMPFRGFSQRDYVIPIKFNNDPSELGYGSDGSLVVESRPIERKISTADLLLLKNEEAKKTLGPIKNLVCAVDAQVVVHSLQMQKHRLNRDSTILFTQKGMKIMEMVNEQVFPDPKTRPTYIAGIFSHAVWKSHDHATSPDDRAHEMESGSSSVEASAPPNKLSVKHGIFGSLILGPVAPVEGESVMQRVRRQQSANYFVSALLAAPSLRARCLPANLLLRIRLRNLAVNSVVGPSTVRFQCNNGGLLANEERIAHLKSRLREADRIVQTFDLSLTYEYLEKRLGDYLVMSADRVNILFKNVLAGRKSDIEWNSGWLVEQGRILAKGGPGLCPGHEDDLMFIQEMTEAAAILRVEEEEEERLARAEQRRNQLATNRGGEVQSQVEREQEELANILDNQRMKEERKKRKQQKTLRPPTGDANGLVMEEIIVGSDGGSNSSGTNEVMEVVHNLGIKKNDISEDTAFITVENPGSSDSPPSSGFKIRKDLSRVEGDNTFPQRFASKEIKSFSQNAGDEAGSNTVEPIL